jgi:hypothetical protein
MIDVLVTQKQLFVVDLPTSWALLKTSQLFLPYVIMLLIVGFRFQLHYIYTSRRTFNFPSC